MEIRDIRPSEIEPARRLLEASGWTRRVSDPADFRDTTIAVATGHCRGRGWRSHRVLACLTDGMANGYISMLVVAEDHRRKGVGRALVNSVRGDGRGMSLR